MHEIKEFIISVLYTIMILIAIALIIISGGLLAQFLTKYISINTLSLICIFFIITYVVHLIRKLK